MDDTEVTKLDVLKEAMARAYGGDVDLTPLGEEQVLKLWEGYKPFLAPHVDNVLMARFPHGTTVPDWVDPFYPEVVGELGGDPMRLSGMREGFVNALGAVLEGIGAEGALEREGGASGSSPEE